LKKEKSFYKTAKRKASITKVEGSHLYQNTDKKGIGILKFNIKAIKEGESDLNP